MSLIIRRSFCRNAVRPLSVQFRPDFWHTLSSALEIDDMEIRVFLVYITHVVESEKKINYSIH